MEYIILTADYYTLLHRQPRHHRQRYYPTSIRTCVVERKGFDVVLAVPAYVDVGYRYRVMILSYTHAQYLDTPAILTQL